MPDGLNKAPLFNPRRKHDLTIDEVKACPCFANFTDDQAAEVIKTFKEFTLIVFYSYRQNKAKKL